MDGQRLAKEKLVSCYLKKKGVPIAERKSFDNMENLEDLITSEYEVKGELNWKSLQKARKIDDVPLERDEQKIFCKWLKDNKIAHFANGLGFQMLSPIQVNALKAIGHYSNIPDMTILLGNGRICFVEMKRRKGGVVSEGQKKMIDYLNENNYPTKVCKGYDDAIEFVKSLIESEVR